MVVNGPNGPQEMPSVPPSPTQSSCVYNDVHPGLPPGHYVIELRAGSEILAKGAYDITPTNDAERWAEFSSWARGDLQTASVALNTLNSRTAAGDVDGAVDAGRALERSASSQLQYLSVHPPAQCYANIHALIVTGMTHMKNMGTAAAARDLTGARFEKDKGYPALVEAAKLIPAAEAVCTA